MMPETESEIRSFSVSFPKSIKKKHNKKVKHPLVYNYVLLYQLHQFKSSGCVGADVAAPSSCHLATNSSSVSHDDSKSGAVRSTGSFYDVLTGL